MIQLLVYDGPPFTFYRYMICSPLFPLLYKFIYQCFFSSIDDSLYKLFYIICNHIEVILGLLSLTGLICMIGVDRADSH